MAAITTGSDLARLAELGQQSRQDLYIDIGEELIRWAVVNRVAAVRVDGEVVTLIVRVEGLAYPLSILPEKPVSFTFNPDLED